MIVVNRHTPLSAVKIWKDAILSLAPAHRVLTAWTATWSNPRGVWELSPVATGEVKLKGPGGEWILQDNDVASVERTITAMGALPA